MSKVVTKKQQESHCVILLINRFVHSVSQKINSNVDILIGRQKFNKTDQSSIETCLCKCNNLKRQYHMNCKPLVNLFETSHPGGVS